MLGIASLFPNDITPLIPALQNGPLLTIHVSTMMISYAVLTVAFCGAVVYLVQGGEGKRRFASLPSADAAGDLANKAVIVGFPLLGLGIALGAWWANSAWGRYWGWDPKETSALVTWLSIAAYFHARAGNGRSPGARHPQHRAREGAPRLAPGPHVVADRHVGAGDVHLLRGEPLGERAAQLRRRELGRLSAVGSR